MSHPASNLENVSIFSALINTERAQPAANIAALHGSLLPALRLQSFMQSILNFRFTWTHGRRAEKISKFYSKQRAIRDPIPTKKDI